MEISRQELEYARQLAAIKRAKRGIGVSKDVQKSSYLENGGNPDPPQEETVPEEKESEMAARMRRMREEAMKRIAKKVVKKVAKKAFMALLKNPYVLAAIGIILGVIFLILLIVVVVQQGNMETAREEGEYVEVTTEAGEPIPVHMPELKGL
jgi:hypothetical protein